jgi:hypothetical protein
VFVFHMVLTINNDLSLNSIKQSSFVAETLCVSYEVRTILSFIILKTQSLKPV